ncbi:hypothetical protein D3C79_918160 [compost metagenome]
MTDSKLGGRFPERLDELVILGALYIDAVSTQAVLTRGGELSANAAFHCFFDGSVIENNERSVTAQLQRYLLDGVARLLEQNLPDLGRASEAEGSYLRVLQQACGMGDRITRNYLEHTCGDTCFLC